MSSNPLQIWDGSRQPVELVAMDLLALSRSGAAPAPMLAAVSTGLNALVVRPAQLGPFLRLHATVRLLCHDAGELHWVLDRHLGDAGDADARQILWNLSDAGRLHDVQLLEQLVRLAEQGGSRPRPRTLRELAEGHVQVVLDDDAAVQRMIAACAGSTECNDPELAGVAMRRAQAVWHVGAALLGRVRQLTPGAPTAAGGDLLSLALQVRAAIALAHARHNGLRLAPLADSRIQARLAAIQAPNEAILAADRAAQQCFQWDPPHRLRYTPNGAPAVRPGALRGWLRRTIAPLEGLHRSTLNPPLGDGGRLSETPEDWGALARCNAVLRAWQDLKEASGAARAFVDPAGSDIHPVYEVLPHARSRDPCLDVIRRVCGGGFFEPRPCCHFLAVELCDLQLRALAAVCRRHFGRCLLAELFERGEDPHEQAAAALAGLSPREFAKLAATDEPTYARWRRIARALLWAVPTGLSLECVREAARLEFGLDDIGLAEVTRLNGVLLHQVFPELGPFLQDDTLSVMAGNLNVRLDDLAGALSLLGRPNSPDPAELRRCVGRDAGRLPADRREKLQIWLAVCNNNPSLRPLLARRQFNDELYAALFGRRIASGSGRMRGGMFFANVRAALSSDLADDAAKAALYALVRSGFRVAAYVSHEILMEIPTSADLATAALDAARTANAAVQSVLQCVPAGSVCRQCHGKWPLGD